MTLDHRSEVVEFGVARGVVPHLAGRFLGEYETDGGGLEVLRDPTQGPSQRTQHTQTYTLGLSAALHQSPCHPQSPALNMFTFNRDPMFCLKEQRGRKIRRC